MIPREEPGRNEVGLRKKAATLGSIIALIALAVGSFFGDRGMLRLMAQQERVERLRQQIEELRAENERLAAEIVALRTSPRAIERLAREELGLSRSDETVFLIHEQDAESRP